MTDYLYHLTSAKNQENINRNGLCPAIGPHSAAVGETTPYVYLCEEKDVPYWNVLLNADLLCIIPKTAVSKDIITFSYRLYDEILYPHHILPGHIRTVSIPDQLQPTAKERQELCLSYMNLISHTLVQLAYLYEDPEHITTKDYTEFHQRLCNLQYILPGLPYQDCPPESRKASLLQEASEGEYTFADRYKQTDHRLYEQLLYYPDDCLSDLRTWLHQYIKQTFPECLTLNTGGWDTT